MPVYKGSRYTNTEARLVNNESLILGFRRRERFDLSKATFYTVVQGDTVDGISFNQYGNSSLYWAILDANPKYPTEIVINPGDILVIPSFEEVIKKYG